MDQKKNKESRNDSKPKAKRMKHTSAWSWNSMHSSALNDCIKHHPHPNFEKEIIKSWRDCFNTKSSIPDEILEQKIKEAMEIKKKEEIRPKVTPGPSNSKLKKAMKIKKKYMCTICFCI